MGKQKLKLKNWPFEKGEKAQLIWIGEPFKENNKWMIDTYFSDGKNTKKVIQDWANIYFLSIDKYYVDGDLKSGEIIDIKGTISTIDIDLCRITPKYNEGDWNITKSNYKSKSKTFNFWKNNVLYTVPIIEIVRAILAPNTFMLNTILYNDAWEDYFTYELEDRNLQIDFTNNYKKSYLKSTYYNHLAWMISNNEVLKMCNDIGYNMLSNGKLLFDFNVPNFSIRARVKKNKHGFTIMEILKVNLKEIKIDELKIYHPSFEERVKSNEAKLRTYTYLSNKDEDRIIDNSVDGAKNFDESIDNELIVQEYIKAPIVKKEKERSRKLRTTEDDETKKYIKEDDNSRTLSSEGGMKRANGIEVSAVDEKLIPAEFKELIYSLRGLEKSDWVRKVDIRVVMLPLGRKFSYLSNGIVRRKCLIAEIYKFKGEIFGIIEIERQDKLLSTLILKGKLKKELQLAYEELLIGLVRESGKWSIKAINNIKESGITISRNKHIDSRVNNIIQKIKA
ncbi:UNVERIFIED_ORG: hypothetical protein B2H93_01700 [Clostridium botulinum]